MLNLILHYQMPKSLSKVSGIPTDWKRSPFNKRQKAGAAFLKIIDEIDAKYFLISYNSEGFLPKQQFSSIWSAAASSHSLRPGTTPIAAAAIWRVALLMLKNTYSSWRNHSGWKGRSQTSS
ncbi:MAG: hypothetical protein OXE95_14405 [Chloroflexi bacterium]|nr:hypothetical protein [Chloroflexota bacterium]MCY4248760.1 hypothetical protein [Chloroflexota bacterium]